VGTYIDIGVIAIFAIALIVGLIKGFNKQITKLLGTFGALLVGLVGAYFLANLVAQLNMFSGVVNTFSGIFSGMAGASTEVTSAEELKTALESGPLLIFSFMVETVWAAMQALNFTTAAMYCGYLMLWIICYIVLFIVLYIIVKLLFKGLRKLFEAINRMVVFKILDKLLGAVWAVAMLYAFLVVIGLTGTEIIITKWVSGSAENLYGFLQSSKVLTFIHNTNYLGKMIAGQFQIELPQLVFAG